MTKEDKMLLISGAAQLYDLGLKVEMAREALKNLVESGEPYDCPKMIKAFDRFAEADNKWKRLELEHLHLKERLELGCNTGGGNNRRCRAEDDKI